MFFIGQKLCLKRHARAYQPNMQAWAWREPCCQFKFKNKFTFCSSTASLEFGVFKISEVNSPTIHRFQSCINPMYMLK